MQRSEPSNVVASLFLDHPVHRPMSSTCSVSLTHGNHRRLEKFSSVPSRVTLCDIEAIRVYDCHLANCDATRSFTNV